MLLLISDANILIDIEIGGLVAPMFSLDFRFAVPDVLFVEELEGRHGYLLDMGLESKELDAQMVARVAELAQQYPKPGRNDLFALVLAATEECPLLTGDKDLKAAAEQENVEVRGTLWLVAEMVRTAEKGTLPLSGQGIIVSDPEVSQKKKLIGICGITIAKMGFNLGAN